MVEPQASVRLYFFSDGHPVNLHFRVSDAYAANLVEKLKEAGWKERTAMDEAKELTEMMAEKKEVMVFESTTHPKS